MSEVSEKAGRGNHRKILVILSVVALAIVLVAIEIRLTRPVRDAVRTYTQLIQAANREDLNAIESLCTERYRKTHVLKFATEGGMIGLPRNIHKNFQVWREGDEVWLCPTNRVGPVYRFVLSDNQWKFDGLVGQLVPGGRVEPMADENEITTP